MLLNPTENDKTRLEDALQQLSYGLRDKPMSTEQLNFYLITLINFKSNTIGDFTFDRLMEALKRIGERWTERDFPKPAHIMATIDTSY